VSYILLASVQGIRIYEFGNWNIEMKDELCYKASKDAKPLSEALVFYVGNNNPQPARYIAIRCS
jgi:hypothetical protein